MKLTQPRETDLGFSLLAACGVGALLGFGINALMPPPRDAEVKPIDTSLTFTATNRLVVTHYILIPATPGDWSTLTNRYPANVTRTTLKFE